MYSETKIASHRKFITTSLLVAREDPTGGVEIWVAGTISVIIAVRIIASQLTKLIADSFLVS